MENKIEHALSLASEGFKVFPLTPGAKAPPLVIGWPQQASSEEHKVREFWTRSPEANIGLSCEGLLVIDVDVKSGGDASYNLLNMMEDLPATLFSVTPTGGRHFLYALPAGHPGVSNSVQVLGKGLDVRSTGGYVVAPGSEIHGKAYRFQNPGAAIADAPRWLLDRLGAAQPKAEAPVSVPDAPPTLAETAREWLLTQAPAVEGDGGDAHTFKVICQLRDKGLSEQQAYELMLEWNEDCLPPWNPRELQAKVRNAYKYAQNEPGAKVALPTDFDKLEEEPAPPRKPGAKAVLLSDFANSERKGPGYLIKGLLQRRSYAEIYGAPGEGKTFVALDMAYSVAAGLPWMGRKVHAGPVLYLAYEGTGGLIKRAQALQNKHGSPDVPFYMAASASFNLREAAGRKELAEVIAEMPAPPALIVIDTLARALMGGDENSAQDVGAFNSAVASLIESTGACVLIIHHSGKNKAAGARGSSALLGALDTEIEIDGGYITAKKQRDVELGEPIGFSLERVELGKDSDGDTMTSCVVVEGATRKPEGGRLSGNAKRGFEALCELSPNNAPIAEQTWKDACLDFLGERSFRQRYYDLRKTLLRKKMIELDNNGMLTRRME